MGSPRGTAPRAARARRRARPSGGVGRGLAAFVRPAAGPPAVATCGAGRASRRVGAVAARAGRAAVARGARSGGCASSARRRRPCSVPRLLPRPSRPARAAVPSRPLARRGPVARASAARPGRRSWSRGRAPWSPSSSGAAAACRVRALVVVPWRPSAPARPAACRLPRRGARPSRAVRSRGFASAVPWRCRVASGRGCVARGVVVRRVGSPVVAGPSRVGAASLPRPLGPPRRAPPWARPRRPAAVVRLPGCRPAGCRRAAGRRSALRRAVWRCSALRSRRAPGARCGRRSRPGASPRPARCGRVPRRVLVSLAPGRGRAGRRRVVPAARCAAAPVTACWWRPPRAPGGVGPRAGRRGRGRPVPAWAAGPVRFVTCSGRGAGLVGRGRELHFLRARWPGAGRRRRAGDPGRRPGSAAGWCTAVRARRAAPPGRLRRPVRCRTRGSRLALSGGRGAGGHSRTDTPAGRARSCRVTAWSARAAGAGARGRWSVLGWRRGRRRPAVRGLRGTSALRPPPAGCVEDLHWADERCSSRRLSGRVGDELPLLVLVRAPSC